jgi:hypothetical protein
MHQIEDTGVTTRPAHQRGPTAPAVRTYREIAEILARREGTQISPACVRRTCRAAERKFACALLVLLADAVFHEWLGPGAARVH